MRVAKLRLERCYRAAEGQQRRDQPICCLQLWIANKAVIDQGDVGTPHEDDDALEVQLLAQREDGGTMVEEDMESD